MAGVDPATITAIASVAGPMMAQMRKPGGVSTPLGGVPPVTAMPPPGPGGTPPFARASRRPGGSPDSFEDLLEALLRSRGSTF